MSLLPFLSSCDELTNKRVLLRIDLDLPEKPAPQKAKNGTSPEKENTVFDTTRLEDALPTIVLLKKLGAKSVTVMAHRGHHPVENPRYSLEPIAALLYERAHALPPFSKKPMTELTDWLTVRENLRFDPREEANDPAFALLLTENHDVYVFEAFATAHRTHTSVTQIPLILPTYFGLHFEKEMEYLERLITKPKRPFVCLLGGAKIETKLPLIEKLAEWVDVILLGGLLAKEAKEKNIKHRRMIIAKLNDDNTDISQESCEKFERFVLEAKTFIWNGPMGIYEKPESAAGTKAMVAAIAQNTNLRVVGGGDTEAAISEFHTSKDRIATFVSTGGGALLHGVAYQTLPVLDAVRSQQKKQEGAA